jgi:hypothetical protein
MTPQELEDLRRDAMRYRWLRCANPQAVASIAYISKDACNYEHPDDAVDAAINEANQRISHLLIHMDKS